MCIISEYSPTRDVHQGDNGMATIFDVAAYITQKTGALSAMKLQKLMYYAQAWTLVWREEPLFNEDFEAWANGPVIPELYARHRGQFTVEPSLFADGAPEALKPQEKVCVDNVIDFYGDKTAQWLSDLTHQEDPWLKARGGVAVGASSNAIVTQASMHEYYSGL